MVCCIAEEDLIQIIIFNLFVNHTSILSQLRLFDLSICTVMSDDV